ncbi:S-methyl-5'-thioadenosine phosphorylase [Vulcanisaeta thermophila]|uniref:S-methyl-5'-thioadenosine phosphorylase n=1 Tax=Vulcanisaeta thermophila TaxID=867917 RepID=UPI000852E55D|nr:S-methyl-5'-thioadenosine phosphorylase [Vulcanisaeta thermophila]
MGVRLVKLGNVEFPLKPTDLGIEELPFIGVIGGSGLYEAGLFSEYFEVQMHTPYGMPSDNIVIGRLGKQWVAFLPRHGRGHKYPPHRIPYRANIWSLWALGVKAIISVSAVGSLRQDFAPGDFVIPDQFFDATKNREYTFFDGPRTCHIQIGLEPFSSEINQVLYEEASKVNRTHLGGCYICIEGPRFSTKAESRVWRDVYGCDIIGMTLVPEINLARELGMCYSLLALITDYDIWVPHQPVTAELVEKVMTEKLDLARKVLANAIPRIPRDVTKKCEETLKNACV